MFNIVFNTKRTATDPHDHKLAELADKLNEAIASAKLAVYTNGVGGRICHVVAHYHSMIYYILSKYILSNSLFLFPNPHSFLKIIKIRSLTSPTKSSLLKNHII